jgi:hypothetical protein
MVALKMARFGPFFLHVCGHGHPRGPLTEGYGRHGLIHTSVELDTPGAKAPNLVLLRVGLNSTILVRQARKGRADRKFR